MQASSRLKFVVRKKGQIDHEWFQFHRQIIISFTYLFYKVIRLWYYCLKINVLEARRKEI